MDDQLSAPPEGPKPDEEPKEPKEPREGEEKPKGSAKPPKKPRVARKKISPADAPVSAPAPEARGPPAVDATFFAGLGATLRDLKREKKAQKFSSFVVA